MRKVLRGRATAVVALLVALVVAGVPRADASQLDGVPEVVALGALAPASVHPNDVLQSTPVVAGDHSFVSVQLVDPYGGTHVLSGSPGVAAAVTVPEWWPAGHYRLAAITVTAGTLFGGSTTCFYCYAVYDLDGGHVYENAYDEGFTDFHSSTTDGVPFSQAEIDAVGVDVVNPGGDVAIADLDSATLSGSTFPAGATPRVTLAWGADVSHPYDSGFVTVVPVRRGVDDISNARTWPVDVNADGRGGTADLTGIPNGRYRISSLTLQTDDRYQLVASAGGSTKYPPLIGGGAVNANLSALKLAVGVPPDVTPPVVRVPVSVDAEAVGPAGATVSYVATADDDVDGALLPTCAPASGSTFALGSTAVLCAAVDDAGNHGSASFDVVVRDTTAPVLALPSGVTAEATSPAGAPVSFDVAAADAVDGAVTPSCAPVAGSTFPLGSTDVTCGAADTRGNATTSSFAVTVVDTTPPVITPPALGLTEAIGPDGAPVVFAATASDLVDGDVTPSCAPASGDMFAIGTTHVTCSATDARGNTSATGFDVVVVDTTAPVPQVPGGVIQEATGPSGAKVTYDASSLDLVDGTGTASCAPASGSTFALGTTHVTCSATDAHGNTATGGFDVLVRDTTAPTLTITGNAGTYDVDATVLLGCTATDAVSSASCSPTSVSAPAWSFGAGARSVTFTARDAAGNVGSRSAMFSVSPTVDGMVRLTTSLVIKAQLTSSLEAKLRSGNYDGYRKELDQQAGKGISASDATLLSNLSNALPPPVSPSNRKK